MSVFLEMMADVFWSVVRAALAVAAVLLTYVVIAVAFGPDAGFAAALLPAVPAAIFILIAVVQIVIVVLALLIYPFFRLMERRE